MKFCLALSCLAAALICIGCGDQATADKTTSPSPSGTAVNTGGPIDSVNVAGAAEAVSLFLDRVRRGGEASQAGELLTAKAQAEFARIGRSVQPIGTPDAKFTVTRSQPIPGEENSVLVHSLWTEPNGAEGGQQSEFQVVWAVQLEQSQWRISGLAMELESGADPMVVDFEDGDMMERLLSPPSQAQVAESTGPATSEQR